MNDEIKELLSYLKKKENTRRIKCITIEESKQLLDYITNLQRERDFYKHMCLKYGRKNYEELYQEKEDYKSRCEKAIEYINKNKHLSMFADCREPEEDWNYDLEINPRDLLNILQNGSDDNEC